MAKLSRWRDHSRAVIERVLAGLPPDATDEVRRKAVSRAYPFSERAMQPYKEWLKEVRRALGPDPKRTGDYKVEFHVAAKTWRFPFWVHVRCGHCEVNQRGPVRTIGCLMCRHLADPLAEWLRGGEFPAMLAACRANPDDELPRLALADYLDETGTDAGAELARLFRATCPAWAKG